MTSCSYMFPLGLRHSFVKRCARPNNVLCLGVVSESLMSAPNLVPSFGKGLPKHT